MAGSRLRMGAWIATAFVLMTSIIALANNPNGTNPYWNGPSGEVVDMFSGELIYPVTDVSIPARGGMNISFTRTFNSELYLLNPLPSEGRELADGSKYTPQTLSPGWQLPATKIIRHDSMIVYPNGNYEQFFHDALGRKKTRQFGVITDTTGNTRTLRFPDGSKMIFGIQKEFSGFPIFDGRYLLRAYDNTGLNWIEYVYYAADSAGGLLKEMRDPEGRYVRITYVDGVTTPSTSARIATISYKGHDGDERTIHYSYTTLSGVKYLTKVKYPNGDSLLYNYSNDYYDGSAIGEYLLTSVTYPTGAKVRYCYEKFLQQTKHCYNDSGYTGDSTVTTENFAVKYVIFEENGTDIDTVKFLRSYTGTGSFDLTAQVADTCDECTTGQKTVNQYSFYGASTPTCSQGPEDSYGLLAEVRKFKGTLNGGLYQSVSQNPDTADYYERYWANAWDAGWVDVTLGTLGTKTIKYPYLTGYVVHIPDTSPDSLTTPFSWATFNSMFGIVVSKKINGDSTWAIVDEYCDTTYNLYLTKVERYNGFDTRYVYETGTTPWTPLLKRVYTVSLSGTRDSIGVGYSYDAYGNVIKSWDNLAIETPGRWLDSTAYDDSTHTFGISSTTRYGLRSRSWIDPNLGQVDSTESATGAKVKYYYDDADRLRYTWRDGDPDTTVKITYFADKRVSQVEVMAVPGSPSIYRKSKSWSDIWGRTIADTLFNMQDNLHKINRYEYSKIGQVKRTFRPWFSNAADSVFSTYKYDFIGRVKEVDSPDTENDSTVTFNNIVTKQFFARDVTTTGWDGKKHKTRTDKYGRVTDTFFDSTGSGAYADTGRAVYLGVTPLPLAVYSPAGDSIVYTYDTWRNVRSVTMKDEGTSYFYTDKRGNLRFAQDANSQWSFFEYDSLSRLIRVGTATSVSSHADSINKMSYVGSGATTRVSYFYGRYDSPPDTVADTLNGYYGTSGTNYNSVSKIKGMLTQVNDEACKTFYVFDEYGRTVGKIIHFNPVQKWPGAWVSPGVKIINYDYNVTDQIEAIYYPGDDTALAKYEFYDSGLLRRVPGFIGYAGDPETAAYEYKPWGAVEEMQYANGQVQAFKYDPLSRLQKIACSDWLPSHLDFGESYVYHNQYLTKVYADSNISLLRSGPRQYYYHYDYRGRLDSASYDIGGFGTSRKYSYDKANNRRSVNLFGTVTYHNLYAGTNRLKNTASTSGSKAQNFTYDSNGNMLSDTPKKREYRYDYRNMIDTLTQKSAISDTLTDTLVYAYNYKNQRVMKLIRYWTTVCPNTKVSGDLALNESGRSDVNQAKDQSRTVCLSQDISATFFVWSGDEVIAEYNIEDVRMSRFIIANGQRVARVGNGGAYQTLFLHHDRQGSLRMVTSNTGTIHQKLSYDAFGEVLVQVGSSIMDYTYTGQDWDSEQGINLFYLRNRYYNPSIGRFVTPDPLLSDLNPYSYCNNNPVMMSDPSGLAPKRGDYDSDEFTKGKGLILPPLNLPNRGGRSDGMTPPSSPPINLQYLPTEGHIGTACEPKDQNRNHFGDLNNMFYDDSDYQNEYGADKQGNGNAYNNAPVDKYADWDGAAAQDATNAAKDASVMSEFERKLEIALQRIDEGKRKVTANYSPIYDDFHYSNAENALARNPNGAFGPAYPRSMSTNYGTPLDLFSPYSAFGKWKMNYDPNNPWPNPWQNFLVAEANSRGAIDYLREQSRDSVWRSILPGLDTITLPNPMSDTSILK